MYKYIRKLLLYIRGCGAEKAKFPLNPVVERTAIAAAVLHFSRFLLPTPLYANIPAGLKSVRYRNASDRGTRRAREISVK